MNIEMETSEELLNAFVDGELDAAEKARLLEKISADAKLRGRVCQLWQVKEMLRGAWPATAAKPRPVPRGSKNSWRGHALAASVLLMAGLGAGWIGHDRLGTSPVTPPAGFQLDAQATDDGKYILHLASADPVRQKMALDQLEELAASKDRAGHPVRVELLVNAGGINLLRADTSPYAERVMAMAASHQNVRLVACDSTLENLRLRGQKIVLLPQVKVATTAADQIVLRLQQGWTYLQV